MANRFDYYDVQSVRTNEGFILDKPIIGRSGILKYLNADGTERIEYRPPLEAFNPISLATIKGKPITLGHIAKLDTSNMRSVDVYGNVLSEGVQDGDDIRAEVAIVKELPEGVRELSCGYETDLVEKPGITPDGIRYDAIQTNIRYNHLAIVKNGRAGNARLRLDSSGEQIYFDEKKGNQSMSLTKLRLDSGIDYDVPAEVKIAFDEKEKQIKATKEKVAETEKAKDVAEAERDAAKEDLEKEIKDRQDSFEKAVKGRIALIDVAKAHRIDKFDEMGDMDIKKAVITAVHGDSINLDGKSDDYLNALFDMAKAKQVNHTDSSSKQRKDMLGGGSDVPQKQLTYEEIYAKYKADEAEAYLK